MEKYQLSIITPDGKKFEGLVESLMAPGTEGSFGILSSHAPYIASLKEGPLKIIQDEGEKFFAINAGILEINQEGNALILSDFACEADNAEDAKNKLVRTPTS